MREAISSTVELVSSTRRSGSEKRERKAALAVRLTPDERAALKDKAQAAGLSLGAFVRASALGSAGPRARRSVQVNEVLLAQAVAQLNKAGSNLNQIARTLNAAGVVPSRESAAVLAEVQAAVAEIRRAVGRADRG